MRPRNPEPGELSRITTQRFGRLQLWAVLDEKVSWQHPRSDDVAAEQASRRLLAVGKVVR